MMFTPEITTNKKKFRLKSKECLHAEIVIIILAQYPVVW